MRKFNVDAKTRQDLINELFAIRDGLMWYEDAKGISGHTREKLVIDAAINKLQRMK